MATPGRWTAALLAGALAAPLAAQTPPAVRELRIDPLLLGSVREFRNVSRVLERDLFPGWPAARTPMLLYRPGVQDVLVGVARRPAGFSRYAGPSLLPGEPIYVRNDSTLMTLDDQNTNAELDGIRVLVVADQFSRLRNTLRALRGSPASVVDRWLEGWGFIASPYEEVQLLLHEAFHVHQDRLAPGKRADESAVARYPLLDADNNALFALEGRLLRDALLAADRGERRRLAALFVAVRLERRGALDSAAVAYEDLNEFSEGLGRYVEYRFLRLGDRVTPTPSMWSRAGFRGYRGVLERLFVARMEDMARIAANQDDRFGNRFGAGPLRFRLYDLGAAQALLLDELAPGWKTRVFAAGVYLTDLLAGALPMTADTRRARVAEARAAYGYDSLLAARRAFAAEGRARIQARVDSILRTPQTLVTISYAGVDIRGMAYTPFGVTAVDEQATLYDMVPVAIRFANGVLLEMTTALPVLVNRSRRTVQFAIATRPADVVAGAGGAVSAAEFSLSASAATNLTVTGNEVRVELR